MSETLQAFVQACLNEAVRILAPILVAAVIGWVALAIQKLRAKLGDEKWWAVEQAATFAVHTAEQLGLSGQIANTAREKKRMALNVAEDYLLKRGIKVDLEVLADFIEAAVYEQLTREKNGGSTKSASE